MLFAVLVLLHLLMSLLVFFGIRSGLLKVHKIMFWVALLLPFWGVISVMILHLQIGFKLDDAIDVGVEKLKLESELYKTVTVDEKKVAAKTVPIEEALVINSPKERRSIIMDVLNDNPKEYIEFLQKAGNNEDTEVVHYAVTAMVEISKENDYRLQQFEKMYSENPDDIAVIEDYTDFLWGCISQNLMQGQVMVMNRKLFSGLIERKLSLNPNITDFVRVITNELELKNYIEAESYLKKLKENYPQSEDYYLMKLKYLASLNRGEEIKALISEIESSDVFFSSRAKEELAFWKE